MSGTEPTPDGELVFQARGQITKGLVKRHPFKRPAGSGVVRLAACRYARGGLRSVQSRAQEAPNGFWPRRLGFRLLGDPRVKLGELVGLKAYHDRCP